ncbi:MAG: DUF5667 domain-containing protein [Anaerolineales bacterium]|nr:DUF5667 domain-containing protein [Anaerolineales bacterium]
MTTTPHDKESEHRLLFEPLRQVAARNPAKAAQGRQEYMAQARRLSAARHKMLAVSIPALARLKEWIDTSLKPIQRKERAPMLATLSSLIVIASLAFGGAGATVYAAAQSMPDEPLYQMKIFGEDLRLKFTYQEQAQLELALTFANRRMAEIATMLAAGKEVPEPTLTRLQSQLEYALRLAAQMEGEAALPVLHQVRAQLQYQLGLLDTLQNGYPGQGGLLTRLREMFTAQLRLCELGLEDPLQLQHHLRQRTQGGAEPAGTPPQGNEQAPSPGSNGPAPDPASDGAGPGSNPEPGSGDGASPGECNDCEPPQNGTGERPGPNPEPGDGEGAGPGECDDCEPPQDGTGSGPGPNAGGNNPAPPPAEESNNDAPVQEGNLSGPVGGGNPGP